MHVRLYKDFNSAMHMKLYCNDQAGQTYLFLIYETEAKHHHA